jgi:hypothetical protein
MRSPLKLSVHAKPWGRMPVVEPVVAFTAETKLLSRSYE